MSFEMLEDDSFSFVKSKKASAETVNDGFETKLEDKAIT